MLDKLPVDVVVVDCEVYDDINTPSAFDRPWEIQLSIVSTYSKPHGYRDWLGDKSVPDLIQYLTGFKSIVGFNHVRFDYGVLDGSLTREHNAGHAEARKVISGVIDLGERDPAPGMVATLLRSKSIDIHLDVSAYLDAKKLPREGRRSSLDKISRATLSEGKAPPQRNRPANSPTMWRSRKCFEVLQFCRMDVQRTAGIYLHLANGGNLMIDGWPEKGVNDLGGPVVLRHR